MKIQAIQFVVVAVLAGAAATCMMDFDEFDHGVLSTSTSSGTTTSGTGGAGGTIFTGGGGTTSTGGTGGSTSGTGGSTSGTGGGGGVGGGVGGEAGAGGSVTTAFVGCDQTPCDVSNGGYCCLPQDGGSPSCETSGTGCADGFAQVFCDEPSDCPPGEECCGTFSFVNGYSLLECVASCTGPSHFVVCDSNADCDGNDQCDTSSYLPAGYEVCK